MSRRLKILQCFINEDCNITMSQELEILKRREGDNLGDGKFLGFQNFKMGITLKEDFPFHL